MQNQKLDIVGLGNALLDIQVETNEDFLTEVKVEKASMQLVEASRQAELLTSLLQKRSVLERSSGGCAANTLAGVASFGGQVKLQAKLGEDENALFYIKDLKNVGIEFSTPQDEELPTGTCLALITSDAERTMLTHLGAAQRLSEKDLKTEDHQTAALTYLEGYLWDSDVSRKACFRAAELAKKANKKVALTLSDAYCVDRHFDSFSTFVRDQVDVLFCNESEALRITKKSKVADAFQDLKEACEYVFISVGPRGALLSADHGKSLDSVATWDVPLIDKLGAGDLFAAGVLFGLSQKRSLKECGYLGCYAATRVIQQMSARIQEPLSSHLEMALKGPGQKSTEPLVLSA